MTKLPFETDLSASVAVVTGGAGVICSSFAKVIAKAGAKVAILDLNGEAAQKLAEEINADGGCAIGLSANVLDKKSLEEAKANGQPIDGEAINGIRAGLMGPLAGIGDSLIVGTLIPILLGIGLGLSSGGNPMGAIFYIISWNVLMWFGMRYAFDKGYSLGGRAVEILVGEQAQAVRDSILMVGTVVIGAVAASWINITTSLALPGGGMLQATLDGIYPKMLSAATVIFCWWLMTKKNISPTAVMGLLVVIAFVGVLLGVFDPGLSY